MRVTLAPEVYEKIETQARLQAVLPETLKQYPVCRTSSKRQINRRKIVCFLMSRRKRSRRVFWKLICELRKEGFYRNCRIFGNAFIQKIRHQSGIFCLSAKRAC